MTLRTCVLLACMLIVPGMAMFSHHVPATIRTALRDHLWKPLHDAVDAVAVCLPFQAAAAPPATSAPRAPAGDLAATAASGEKPAEQPATRDRGPATAAKQEPPARVVMPTVTVAPVNRIVEHVPPEGGGLAVPVGTSEAAARSFTQPRQRPSKKAAVASSAAPEPPGEHLALPERMPPPESLSPPSSAFPPEPPLTAFSGNPSGQTTAAEFKARLENLGAFGVECQPTPGAGGGYASSCRVNADPSGQLHRMFHGAGMDAAAAMQSLLDQVHEWTLQHAGTPPARF